jgi:hypothetical protein
MIKPHFTRHLLSWALIAVFPLAVVVGISALVVYAQSSGCPTIDTQPYWPPCATVYYTISSNITDSQERSQIQQAVSRFNSANLINGSKVELKAGPPPTGTSNPRTLLFQNGTLSAGVAARFDTVSSFGDGLISATITINPSCII